jgi:hypothetical protein
LPAIVDHSSHALLIKGALEEDGVTILDELRKGLFETITGEVGCPNKERGFPIFFNPPHGPQAFFLQPQ